MTTHEFLPLTPARWGDLVTLFGPERGACAGCWCLWPRVRGRDFRAMDKQARRDAFEAIVKAGPPPGLLLYEAGVPTGWVSVGPRREVARFNLAKVSAPADDISADLADCWAITCFFVQTHARKRGLTRLLAEAAIDYARAGGARAIEVCAIEPDRPLSWGEGFVGIASQLRPLGFVEITRRSPKRPLLRLMLN